MASVLVLEDEGEKLRHLTEFLLTHGCQAGDIDTASDVVGAIACVQQRHYDIALVDLLVPMRKGQRPDRTGGVHFIRELHRQKVAAVPTYLVGITAFEDVGDEFVPFFSEHLFGLVIYDPTSDAWQRALHNLLAHAKAAQPTETPSYDLAVVCALEDPELRELLGLPLNWRANKDVADSTEYFAGEITKQARTLKVIAAAAPQMGMPAAAAITMKIALKCRPRYLAMVGIAAALDRGVNHGDVILGDPCWDYGSGKHAIGKDGKALFQLEPWQVRVDPMVRTQFRAIARDHAALDVVRREWNGNPPDTVLRLHIGPLGSGAVVASKKFIEDVRKQNRKVQAIDMETYGTMFAGSQCPVPAPQVFALKGVSDFADEKKDDRYRRYASFTSARVLLEWARRYL